MPARGEEGCRARAASASREPPRVVRPLGTVAAEGLEPAREIDRVAAEAALGQQDRDLARRPRVALARGVDDHAREARRQREAGDRAALVGDAALAVDRAEGREQRARFGERAARRGIEKGELAGIGDAPDRAVEQEAGEIGGENLGRGVGLKSAVGGLLP